MPWLNIPRNEWFQIGMKNPYESSKLLGEYLLFHYGADAEVMPWENGPVDGLQFVRRTVEDLMDLEGLIGVGKALDLGCAVGGSTFVLAKYFNSVLGIDSSESFIEAAKKLSKEGYLEYEYLVEGDKYEKTVARRTETSGKVLFSVGDACDLPSEIGSFDLVHAANLICRLPDPRLLIERFADLVKIGGQLVLTTPFTWLEEYTSQSLWLGNGDSKENLEQMLGTQFKLEKSINLPFVIREHRRKFQYSVSFGTRWKRI